MSKRNKYFYLYVLIGIGILSGAAFVFQLPPFNSRNKSTDTFTEIFPQKGRIEISITSMGTVQPRNRVEVKPGIAGRIDKILVKEGEWVKEGQPLSLMSSTERATLLDAARLKGPETLKYWENAYKQIPLIAPISGQIVLLKAEPGQTVTQADVILALSDKLIVKAQVDETDIGKVKKGQAVNVALDAYSNKIVKGRVAHISYESIVVNNVTVYEVDIILNQIPGFFRSGMSANSNILINVKDNILILPVSAIEREKRKPFVYIRDNAGKKPQKRYISIGLSNDSEAEITSGLTATDIVLVKDIKYSASNPNKKENPFMMSRRGGSEQRNRGH